MLQSILLVVLFTLFAPSSASATASFTGLGDLAGGSPYSQAYGVSADGSVVVGRSGSALGNEAFRWTQSGGMVGLGDFAGGTFNSTAFGVSADGSTVVGYGITALPNPPPDPPADPTGGPLVDVQRPMSWTQGGGMQSLLFSSDPANVGVAFATSADGSAAVGWRSLPSMGSVEAFRWTAGGGLAGLGDLTGGLYRSEAFAMSADGSVVVGYGESALGEEAFRWTQSGGMVGLGDNSGSSLYRSRGLGVSADGSTVVGFRNGNFPEAFIWTQSAGMVGLGELQSVPGGFSISWGVSGDGSVVVGSAGFTAFVWDAANGMRSLEQVLLDQGIDLTGWDLKAALAVSADGQTIVGRGIGPAGEEAWIATIPEPSTALLLGLGLLGLGMAGSKPCEPFS